VILAFLMLISFAVPVLAEEYGFIEIKADVPEGFNKTIIVTLTDDFDNYYNYRVFSDNNYVSNQRLPEGNYYVMGAIVEFDSKMEFPTSFSPYELTVKNVPLASLISIQVSDDSLFKPTEPTNTEEPEQPIIEDEPIIKENPVETPEPELTEPTEPEPVVKEIPKQEDTSILSSLLIFLVIIIILFIIGYYIKYKQEH
jgi:hypothetical protein